MNAGAPDALAARIVELATAQGISIAVAESLTGGLVTAALVDVPGASRVLRGGFVTYATELKHSLLGVPAERLAATGPVDEEVAGRMAWGARQVAAIGGVPATIGLATTGVAGPDPQGGKPVGLVWFGLSSGTGYGATEDRFQGDRAAIRAAATRAALGILLAAIEPPDRLGCAARET